MIMAMALGISNFQVSTPGSVALYSLPTSNITVGVLRSGKYALRRQAFAYSHSKNDKGLSLISLLLTNRRKPLLPVNAVASSQAISDGEMPSNEDFITRVLRENPVELEVYASKEGKIYAQPVKKNIISNVPETSQASENTNDKVSSKLRRVVEKMRKSEDDVIVRGDGVSEDTKPVYLKDLLRKYKGQLYVPEEAFKFHVPDIDEFNKSFESLPEISKEQFIKAAQKNKIKMLTSRAILSRKGVPTYHEFIVELKGSPAKKRSMILSAEEAKTVLKEYSGPRHEVEKLTSTAYVTLPPVVPHVEASTFSSRVLLEFSVIMTYSLYAIKGLLSVPFLATMSVITSFVIPLMTPVFQAFGRASNTFSQTLLELVLESATSAIDFLIDLITSKSIRAMVQSTFVMVAVVICMVILIRFTLTRRPKDYSQWDLWQCLDFSLSKPQARVEGTTGVKFDDVAGIDEVVDELRDLVRYLKNPNVYNQMGSKPPHGVLLEGPPGCGKTLLAKAIAGEAGVPFYQMAGSEFDELIVGVGAARIRDLFKRAQANKPSVVFIDEIDGLGLRRNDYSSPSGEDSEAASGQERETTLNQLLTELDGFDTGKGVIFLGATNRMDLLDPALLRPGRFDRKISIEPPDAQGCLAILKVHSKKVKLSPSVDLSYYAKVVAGWSGAQLAQLLQESALMALRNHHDSILPSDMEKAINRITFGPEHSDTVESPFLLRRAASEIGIALTSHLLRRLEKARIEPCISVSIIPSSTTLTRTTFDLLDDMGAYNLETRGQLLHRLQVLLGGRAAEEVVFGQDTSTCSLTHLPDASWLARKMISIWNLENPLSVHGEPAPWKRILDNTGPVLTFEGSLYNDQALYSKSLNDYLDSDISVRTERLLSETYRQTVELLQRYHAALVKSIHVIKETWELKGEDLELILDLYPADTSIDIVEKEASPGSLPSRGDRPGLHLEGSNGSDRQWQKVVKEQKFDKVS